jgi:hypothetical protein
MFFQLFAEEVAYRGVAIDVRCERAHQGTASPRRSFGDVAAAVSVDHQRHADQTCGCDSIKAGRPVVDVEDVGSKAGERHRCPNDQVRLDSACGVALDRHPLDAEACSFDQSVLDVAERDPREIEVVAIHRGEHACDPLFRSAAGEGRRELADADAAQRPDVSFVFQSSDPWIRRVRSRSSAGALGLPFARVDSFRHC